jgi:hypothetical protein
MSLDGAVLPSDVVLQLPSRGIESIPNCDVEILMSTMFAGPVMVRAFRRGGAVSGAVQPVWCPIYNDFMVGNLEIDSDLKCFSFAMMAVRRLDAYVAARDAFEKTFELLGSLANIVLHCRGLRNVVKADAQRIFHERHSLVVAG